MSCHHKAVVAWDRNSGYEGTHYLAWMFDQGWQTLVPLHSVNGWCVTLLYWP